MMRPSKNFETDFSLTSFIFSAPNQIIFAPTITSHVFKGRSLKRQYAVKNKALETFEEDRKDYTREAGEETSGL